MSKHIIKTHPFDIGESDICEGILDAYESNYDSSLVYYIRTYRADYDNNFTGLIVATKSKETGEVVTDVYLDTRTATKLYEDGLYKIYKTDSFIIAINWALIPSTGTAWKQPNAVFSESIANINNGTHIKGYEYGAITTDKLTELEGKTSELELEINGGNIINLNEKTPAWGYYNTASGVQRVITFEPNSSSTHKCYYEEVSYGDKFKIYGKGNSGSTLLYSFLDDNRNFVDRVFEAIDSRNNGIEVTIPNGVSYIVINLRDFQESTDKIYKMVTTESDGLKNDIVNLKEQKVSKNQIVNNLTDGGTDKPLSAEQGKKLASDFYGITEVQETIVNSVYETSNYFNMNGVAIDAVFTQNAPSPAESSVCLPYKIAVQKGEVYIIKGIGKSKYIGLYTLTGAEGKVKDFKQIYDANLTPIEIEVKEDGFLYVNLADYTTSTSSWVKKRVYFTIGGVDNKINDAIEAREDNQVDLIIMCGDSQIGQANESFVNEIKKEKRAEVLSCGFGGMRYAYLRTDYYNQDTNAENERLNAFTMIEVAKALTTGDFTQLENGLANYTAAPAYFATTIENLKTAYNKIKDGKGEGAVLTISYGGNDYNSGTSVGMHGNENPHTMIGAQEYSLNALINRFPRLRIIVVGLPWRMFKDDNNQYTIDSNDYTKQIDGKAMTRKDYSDAIIDNPSSYYQIQVFDMYRKCRRCYLNAFEIGPDGTHPTTQYGGKLAGMIYSSFIKNCE